MASWVKRFEFRLRGEATLGVMLGVAAVATLLAIAGGGAFGESSATNSPPSISVAKPRVVILKQKRRLLLFDADRLVRSYPMDLGVAPIGQKFRKGDGRTPLGRFRVVTMRDRSPYHRFIGLDYPGPVATDAGLASGLISPGEAVNIRHALEAGRCPDWGTALGGGIGIHGQRNGRDWTGGCVAVSDEHVEEIFQVLRIGDTVEILP